MDIPGITDASFDELCAKWHALWPSSQICVWRVRPDDERGDGQNWICEAIVHRTGPGPKMHPPLGRGSTPTNALRAIIGGLITEGEPFASMFGVSL